MPKLTPGVIELRKLNRKMDMLVHDEMSTYIPVENRRRDNKFRSRRRLLQSYTGKKSEIICDCGRETNHHKVMFVDTDNNLIDEWCPYAWYWAMWANHMDAGKGSEFLGLIKLEDYVGGFSE